MASAHNEFLDLEAAETSQEGEEGYFEEVGDDESYVDGGGDEVEEHYEEVAAPPPPPPPTRTNGGGRGRGRKPLADRTNQTNARNGKVRKGQLKNSRNVPIARRGEQGVSQRRLPAMDRESFLMMIQKKAVDVSYGIGEFTNATNGTPLSTRELEYPKCIQNSVRFTIPNPGVNGQKSWGTRDMGLSKVGNIESFLTTQQGGKVEFKDVTDEGLLFMRNMSLFLNTVPSPVDGKAVYTSIICPFSTLQFILSNLILCTKYSKEINSTIGMIEAKEWAEKNSIESMDDHGEHQVEQHTKKQEYLEGLKKQGGPWFQDLCEGMKCLNVEPIPPLSFSLYRKAENGARGTAAGQFGYNFQNPLP